MKPVHSPTTGSHMPREACCPTCGHPTQFTFLGEQRWPEKVAQTLGIPAVVEQWLCGQCHTTITEPVLP
jgi:ribosomal protein S27AE